MAQLTQSELRELLDYDPSTGVFRWRVFRGGSAKIGAVAGTPHHLRNKMAYWRIVVGASRHYAHRLAWLYVTGEWPVADIDHISGDGLDNRFCNLREATRSQNCGNTGIRRDNTSGLKGVGWFRRDACWKAQIGINGRKINLGYFDTAEAAHAAYMDAARDTFGKFARAK